jgi:hypothetical protein
MSAEEAAAVVETPVVEEKKAWLPNPREGEHVFGVAHIFASFNDTFVVSDGFVAYSRHDANGPGRRSSRRERGLQNKP